jgi:hypothetical protein
MAIKLKKDPWKSPKQAEPTKKTFPESIDWLADTAFKRWRASVKKGEGSLSHECIETYMKAVQLGFKGHMGMWQNKILDAGGMSMDDFPSADPNDPRPDKWPEGGPLDL